MRAITSPLPLLFVLCIVSCYLRKAACENVVPASASTSSTSSTSAEEEDSSSSSSSNIIKKTAFVDPKPDQPVPVEKKAFVGDGSVSNVKNEDGKKDKKTAAFVKHEGQSAPPPIPTPPPPKQKDGVHLPPSGYKLTAIIRNTPEGQSFFASPPPKHHYEYLSVPSTQNFLETMQIPTDSISFLHSPPGTKPKLEKTKNTHGEIIICLTNCEVTVTGFADGSPVTADNSSLLSRKFSAGSVFLFHDVLGRGHSITHTHELKLMSIKMKKDCLKSDCGPDNEAGGNGTDHFGKVLTPEAKRKLAVTGGALSSLPLSYWASMVVPQWFSVLGAVGGLAGACGVIGGKCSDWFAEWSLSRKDERIKKGLDIKEEQVPAHKMPAPVNLVEGDEEEERIKEARANDIKQRNADIDAAAGGF
ncbi:hypothetical protein TrVE_jg10397 [Triparma verrucosa]|uniref:Uncharacterized protein n=1 Tax=Triparma verrucosa TaxID=1606542 RepID=A0A9W7FCB7_9STRA|nr:hypothetical protein TrVE_jg10397 [Triparma verrucosa]